MPSGKNEKQIIETKKEIQRIKEDLINLEAYIEEFSFFLPLAVCIVNPLDIIIDINKAFKDLTSFTEGEVIGESIEGILEKDGEIKELTKEIEKKKPFKKELTLVPREGGKNSSNCFFFNQKR